LRGGGLHYYSALTRKVKKTLDSYTESKSGGSSLMLSATDRESVLGVEWERSTQAGSKNINYVFILGGSKAVSAGASFFTDYEVYGAGPVMADVWQLSAPGSNSAIAVDSGYTYNFHLRAAGGVARSAYGAQPGADLGKFIAGWTPALSVAEAGLFFMRGGLAYAEPSLIPAEQQGNYALRYDGQEVLGGGFAALGDKIPEVFVGRV
jgi:hypothetical protein